MQGTDSPFWPAMELAAPSVPDASLYMNLQATEKRSPNKAAIIFNGESIDYRRVLEQVEQLAGHLQQVCGIGRGDRVVLYTQNSPQYVIAYYAILRADAVVVPVNPMNKSDELWHCISDSGATAIITTTDVYSQVAPLLGKGDFLHAVVGAYSDVLGDVPEGRAIAAKATPDTSPLKEAGAVLWWDALKVDRTATPAMAGGDDPAVMPYTSGTTGNPKGCLHTHRSIMTGIVNSVAWHGLRDDDILLATVPMFHVTGMQTNLNTPVYLGNTVVILSRWSPAAAVKLIRQHQITQWTAIATMVIDLLSLEDLELDDLRSLRYVRGGGAPMPEAVATKLRELLGLTYIEGYGLTETMAAVLFNPPRNPKLHCAGIPMHGVDALIVEPGSVTELSRGSVGEILLSSGQLFSGYWRQPKADAETFVVIDDKRFMRTGDLGYADADGYVFIVDRLKRMINAAGFKVWPSEVEGMLYAHPAIQEACVVAVQDSHRGETVKAFIVLKSSSRGVVTEADVIEWSRQKMAAYKYPRIVEFRESLPRSGTGKVMWRTLQDNENRPPQQPER